MPTGHPPTTARLRRLAAELRRLRSAAGLSRDDAAERSDINRTTLYRVEHAQVRPQKRTLTTLMDLYSASDELRTELLTLLKDSHKREWLSPYHSRLPGEYAAYVSFEAEARSISNFANMYVPGLLQTEEYAEAVLRGPGLAGLSEEEINGRVAARMARQELLRNENPPMLWVIMDEAVLRRQVGGPDVMSRQLARLAEDATLSHVALQVIPFDVGAHDGASSFVLLDFSAGDPEIVYLDSLAGDVFLDSEGDLQRFRSVFDQLRAVGLGPGPSLELIRSLT